MEVNNLITRGCTLQASFVVKYCNNGTNYYKVSSPEYKINNTTFQMQVIIMSPEPCGNDCFSSSSTIRRCHHLIHMKFSKNLQDYINYDLKFSSSKLNNINQVFKSDSCWRLIHEYTAKTAFALNRAAYSGSIATECSFDVSVEVISNLETANLEKRGSFAYIYNDTDSTDFELHGEDGSVPVHKAILISWSDFFRSAVMSDFCEKQRGFMSIPASKKTLQHLKDYMYLRTLSNTDCVADFEHLILLAHQYMMTELEEMCVDKLVTSITAENARPLLHFAIRHEMFKLELALLNCFENGAVKVENLKENAQGKRKEIPEKAERICKTKKKNPHDQQGYLLNMLDQ